MLKTLYKTLLLISCLLSNAQAATYYVSNQGNDANDGLSPATAWQSLAKINETPLADGDQILFQRGQVFRGQLNPRKTYTGLTYGAYGAGARPVIAGSILLTNWQPSSQGAGIYQTSAAGLVADGGEITHLFVNNRLQTIARFPNVDSPLQENWLTVDGKGTDGFSDQALAARGNPDNYWQGATLRIRDYSWTFTVRPVTGYNAAQGYLSVADLGTQLPEWGYFLEGKLSELDHPGEWFYQANTQTVFYYPPAGQNPNQLKIEGSVYKTGLRVDNHDDDAVVEQLIFRHFQQEGVHLNSSARVTVRQCHFENNTIGLSSWNINAAQIVHNSFNYQLRDSIGLNAAKDFDVQGTTVAHNTVLNSAMFPAYGKRWEGVYNGIGINIFGQNMTVRDNWVKNTSWVGINVQGNGGHVVQNNVVTDTLQLLNDGGSVIVMSHRNQILHNILLNAWGHVEASNGCSSTNRTPCSKHSSYGMGIGSNSGFDQTHIKDNIIAFNRDMGVRLNSFTNTEMTGNTIFASDPGIAVQDKLGPSNNNTVTQNQIFSLDPDNFTLYLTNDTAHGTFQENLHCNPYSELLIMRDGRRYGFEHWQNSQAPLGRNANHCSAWRYPVALHTAQGENAISNGNFDADITGWSPSYDPQRLFHEPNRADMDGGALRIVYPRGDNKNLNVSAGSFSIRQGQIYRLAFSVVADGFGDIRLAGNRTRPEYAILHQRYFALTPQRRDYEWFIQAKESTDAFKWLWITDETDAPTYWLDNVSFTPVATTPINPHTLTRLWLNLSDVPRVFNLGDTTYFDVQGNRASGTLTLEPRSGKILRYAEGAPPAPTPPSIKLIHADRRVTLAWQTVPDAESYRLYYAPYPNAEQIGALDVGKVTQFEIDLPPGLAFYVAVTAVNGFGESEYSNIEWFALP